MDSEGQILTVESVADNVSMTTPVEIDRNNVENHGRVDVVNNNNNNVLNEVNDGGVIEIMKPVDSPPPLVKSSPRTKGVGLKKWRRMNRGMLNTVASPAKPVYFSAGTIQQSDGSVSSTNALFMSPGVLVDGFGVSGDSGLDFSPRGSENSEDRSSKSSTAASGPKRYKAPVVLGYAPDKNGLGSLSRNNMGTSAHPSHQGKARAESSKKPRGERVKIEKENSHSSMESDSRSSNILFMQGSNYLASNGTKGGRSMKYDGELNYEAQDRQRSVDEKLRASPDRRNRREFEDVSQGDLAGESSWEVKEEKSENHPSSTSHDPLRDSIFTFQAVHEELEREVQRFKEIGNDGIDHSLQYIGIPSEFISGDGDFPGPEKSQSRGDVRYSFNSLDSEVVNLKQNAILLQNKLNEATEVSNSKAARVTELESELEGIFRQNIEAEVEFLVTSRTTQKSRAAVIDRVVLLEEQKKLASEQTQMVKKLVDTESKAAMLKTQAKKLESYCEDIASTDEMLKLQKKVCKYSCCLLIQLVLLVVLGLLLLQMSPDYAQVVPT